LFSSSDNAVYFYDVNAPDTDYSWIAGPQVLQPITRYESEECVDSSGCYNFLFFDAFGDGLFQGGLSLKWEGEEVLNIAPGEIGSPWQGGLSVYWYEELGQC
jgi:hypothetical protein